MEKYLYGIDFGTTNSAICIFDTKQNILVDTITVPSLLYFTNTQQPGEPLKYTVGKAAVTQYIEEGMKGRFMKSVKRILPRESFTETRVYSHKMTAPELVALILKELKEKADARIGYNCTKAVVGRPVFFDDDDESKDSLAQKRLLKAVQLAGFTDVRFQYEPIAAAYAYEKTISKKEKVLVADLGGGTTDFTFIELDPNSKKNSDRRKDIFATGGIYVGGDSFDSAFMFEKITPHFGRGLKYQSMPGKYLDLPMSLFTNICSWEKMNFFNAWKIQREVSGFYVSTGYSHRLKNLQTLIEHNLGYQLFQQVEETKITLSDTDRATFAFAKQGIAIQEDVTLAQYNGIIKTDIAKIEKYLDRFLLDKQINPDTVDTLFLTGGTSLVKAIQDMFRRKFPNSKIDSGDNFISVAKGMAYSGHLFDN